MLCCHETSSDLLYNPILLVVSTITTIVICVFNGTPSSHHWPSLGTGASVAALAGCWASWGHCSAPSCPAWHLAAQGLRHLKVGLRLNPPSPPAVASPAVDHLEPSVLKGQTTLTDTVTASSVHTSHSVTLLNTDTQTTHLRTQLQSILLPTDHMSNVSHHYSHTQTHTHALKCSPDPLFPVAQRKRSCLTIISGGRGWSRVEQRSKRINHPRSGRLRTATRHT